MRAPVKTTFVICPVICCCFERTEPGSTYIIINPRVAMFKKTYLFWFRNDLTSACVADRMITKKQLLL